MLLHDSHDPAYRWPIGAVRAGERVTLRFISDEGAPTLRCWDGSDRLIAMNPTDQPSLYEAVVTTSNKPMVMWYDFIVGDGQKRYGNAPDLLGGKGSLQSGEIHSYQLTVYDPLYETPDYLIGGTIYQIFPDRFFKGSYRPKVKRDDATLHRRWSDKPLVSIDPKDHDNQALDFFMGNLDGIREKLDYLQELGITVIYLNPIFKARSNHRYDTGDYHEIDPFLGDTQSFDRLAQEATQRGIRLMLDGVFSHTGSDSRYFNKFGHYDELGAYQSECSVYAPWYTFTHFPDQYVCWWDFQTLPTLNKDNPELRRFLLDDREGVIPTWLRHGAAGWRLDVADELPIDLIAKMRTTVKSVRPDAALLGEVWEDASNKYAYGKWRCYCLGDTLDSVMNYPLRQAVLDFFTHKTNATALCRVILHQQETYPAPFYYALMNLLGSHDRLRILNAMNGYQNDDGKIEELGTFRLRPQELKRGKARYVEAMRLLCALPGAPTIYYGDEIGMQGMRDPYNRAPMAWNHADMALHDEIAGLLHARAATPLLKTGFMSIQPDGDDALIVTRFTQEGRDALGQRMPDGRVTVRIQRD